jgi:hypothetical protein
VISCKHSPLLKSVLPWFFYSVLMSAQHLLLSCIIYLQFIEKFQEVKEATRLAASKPTTNGTGSGVTPVTSANASPITARACVPPPRSTETLIPQSDSTPLLDPPNSTNTSSVPLHNSTSNSPAAGAATAASNNAVPNAVVAGPAGDSNTLKASMTAHQRSQSLSGLQVLMSSSYC